MAGIEGKCREFLDKTEWVAIATTGADGPHLAGTWGEFIRVLGIRQEGILLAPVGGYEQTERNLAEDHRIALLCATRQILGANGPGKGCRIKGTGEIQTSGEFFTAAREKFPWARGVLVVRAEEVSELL